MPTDKIVDGWLHESAPNWRDITQLDDMEWGFRPADMGIYHSVLKKYDGKYVILGNQLGSNYMPEYHFGLYEEYARLLRGSNHFRQVASFGDVIIFEVL